MGIIFLKVQVMCVCVCVHVLVVVCTYIINVSVKQFLCCGFVSFSCKLSLNHSILLMLVIITSGICTRWSVVCIHLLAKVDHSVKCNTH